MERHTGPPKHFGKRACLAGIGEQKVLKKRHYPPDKQGESKMLATLTTVSLPQTYCRSCHLSTRSDVARCLHCNKPLQAPPVMPRRSNRRVKPVAIRGR